MSQRERVAGGRGEVVECCVGVKVGLVVMMEMDKRGLMDGIR